jgi:adenylate cyclase
MRILHKIQQKLIPIFLGFLVIIASFWFEVTSNPSASTVRDRLNNIIYDLRMQISVLHDKPISPSATDVFIIDIDENSLKLEGRWPWSRDKISDLLKVIREGGPSVIAFDVVFAEAQENIGDEMIEELAQDKVNNPGLTKTLKDYKKYFDFDQEFADTISKQNDVVLGFILSADPLDSIGALPDPLMILTPEEAKKVYLNTLPGQIGNLPVLQQAAKMGGFVTTLTDVDGSIRHAPLVMAHIDKVYPSLGLAAVMQYYFINKVDINFVQTNDRLAMTDLSFGNTEIRTDAYGQVLIPYKGISGTFPTYSASDILQKKIDPNLMKNKIAFVGASALGLGDLHATPFETSFSGVEIHATMADALLKASFPSIPDWSIGAKIFAIMVIGLFLSLLLPFLSVFWLVFIPILMGVIVGGSSIWLFTEKNIYLSSITVYLMMAGLIAVNVIYGFLFESRKRAALKEMFGQYVPPAHVEKMSESKIQYTFEGESRDMSVLFADIRSFTSISEKLDPTQLKKLLNDYFTPMTKIIFDHGGTIDKYVGDMIMAFWGAPLENTHHALDAVKAGFAMQKAADDMAGKFQDMNVNEIHIGVGINSGFMNVGDMGSKYRRSYTVLGDTVNLASRLESSTKFYHANFIISANTLEGCHGEVIARHLDRVKVVGKADAIEIYHPLCMKDEATPALLEELELLKQAEHYYYQAQWDEATALYEQLKSQHPDVGLYDLYIERIKELKEKGTTAPWDGCYVRVSK